MTEFIHTFLDSVRLFASAFLVVMLFVWAVVGKDD